MDINTHSTLKINLAAYWTLVNFNDSHSGAHHGTFYNTPTFPVAKLRTGASLNGTSTRRARSTRPPSPSVAQPGDVRFQRAILEENLGYCLLLLGRYDAGVARISAAFELALAVGDRRCTAECLQDLCYARLMTGEHAEAIALGERALGAAREGGYRDLEENCHYLLGELGSRTGDLERRDRHFEALQALHPEVPLLTEFLSAVDVTGIIALKR